MLHPPVGAAPGSTSGGLVRLTSLEAAAAAIEQLNARPPLPGSALPLLVRYADTAEEKQRKAAKKERMARGETALHLRSIRLLMHMWPGWGEVSRCSHAGPQQLVKGLRYHAVSEAVNSLLARLWSR